MKILSKMGFKKVGEWHKHHDNLSFEVGELKKENRIVFAFVVDSLVKFIASRDEELEFALNFYVSPKEYEVEETKVREALLRTLTNSTVEIYALKNTKFFGLKRKYSEKDIRKLVKELNAEWNDMNLVDRMKKIVSTDRRAVKVSIEKTVPETEETVVPTEDIIKEIKNINPELEIIEEIKVNEIEIETPEVLAEEEEENIEEIKVAPERKKRELQSYIFTLGKSYMDRGFFNLKTSHSHLVGNDKEDVTIVIGPKEVILGKVSRTANSSGTPRIIGNKPLKMWLNRNFEVNGEVKITFVNKKKIKLEKVS